MRNRAFLKVVLLGLVTLAFAPGLAAAAGQGADLSEMLASSAAARATAVSGPLISVTPGNIDFGVVDVGSQGASALNIQNVGDQDLNLTAADVAPPGSPYTTAFAPVTIPPGAGASLTVYFTPVDASAPNATLTIMSDAANGPFVVALSGDGNVGPVVDPIADKSVNAFQNLTFTVTASDPDDDPLDFVMTSDLPPTATFNTATQIFSWTPNAAEGGEYDAHFTASDGRITSAAEDVHISVTVTNSPPIANAGGNYLGTTGAAIQFNGSGSSDPDVGQTLSFSWAFGDGGTSNATNPTHAYAIPGNFIASLEVCDNGSPQLCDTDVAAVQVVTQIDVQMTLKGNASSIRTNGGGKEFVGIEEVQRPYTDIDVSSIRLTLTGYPMSIAPQTKGVKFGDFDADGVQELQVPVLRADFRALAGQTAGAGPFEMVMTGNFVTPTGTLPLRGTKMVTFKGNGSGAVEASAYPNPFNPETSVSYTVRKDGPVSIRVYSIDGRLVRTLVDGEYTVAGSHEVRWNGMDGSGNRVSSGIYFVKTTAVDGTSVFKLAVTK
jgi:hypothetical protein